jgi:lipopolysaccharide export LptBFGC system permease protein LptF
MSTDKQQQNVNKSQIKAQLLRRIFYVIAALALMPIAVFPLSQMLSGYSFKEISTDFYMVIVAALALLIIVAVSLFGVWPIISNLQELRKQEQDEKEDLGMFP